MGFVCAYDVAGGLKVCTIKARTRFTLSVSTLCDNLPNTLHLIAKVIGHQRTIVLDVRWRFSSIRGDNGGSGRSMRGESLFWHCYFLPDSSGVSTHIIGKRCIKTCKNNSQGLILDCFFDTIYYNRRQKLLNNTLNNNKTVVGARY